MDFTQAQLIKAEFAVCYHAKNSSQSRNEEARKQIGRKRKAIYVQMAFKFFCAFAGNIPAGNYFSVKVDLPIMALSL